MESLKSFIITKLKLKVNEKKSAGVGDAGVANGQFLFFLGVILSV
jgi:hypothetical protein